MDMVSIHLSLINPKIERQTIMITFSSIFIDTLTDEQAEMLWNSHVENDHIIFHIGGFKSMLGTMSKDISPEQYAHILKRIRICIMEEYCAEPDKFNIHEALQNLKSDYTLEMVAKMYDNAIVDMMTCPARASFIYIPKDENPMASYKSILKYFGRDKVNSILFTALNSDK